MVRKVSKSLIFDRNSGLYLIVRPPFPLYKEYSLVGGGIQNGESAEDALTREIREEVGITPHDVISIRQLGTVSAKSLLPSFSSEINLFLVTTSLKSLTLETNWEIRDYAWVSRRDIEAKLSKFYRAIISTYEYGSS